ncbi:hypothetical protein CDAR_563741 [Caerostris darwini]|uniref:Uncharacterized protein n=1 Tax=Caerostris darwini TaxID=1538125 RepID=A0AAV4VXA5_9ARAC|nr:hypothetical protein CDAR_563741 [Caerostris darwini]
MTPYQFQVSCNDGKRRTYRRAQNISLPVSNTRTHSGSRKRRRKKSTFSLSTTNTCNRRRVYGQQRHLNDPLLEEGLFAGGPSPSRATQTYYFFSLFRHLDVSVLA